MNDASFNVLFMKNEYNTQSGFKRKIYCNYFHNYFLVVYNSVNSERMRWGGGKKSLKVLKVFMACFGFISIKIMLKINREEKK